MIPYPRSVTFYYNRNSHGALPRLRNVLGEFEHSFEILGVSRINSWRRVQAGVSEYGTVSRTPSENVFGYFGPNKIGTEPALRLQTFACSAQFVSVSGCNAQYVRYEPSRAGFLSARPRGLDRSVRPGPDRLDRFSMRSCLK